jgi:hypothetical protein
MELFDELRKITTALREADVPFALVGALALAIHGVPRATEDIDILVRPDDLSDALKAVAGAGYTAPAAPMTFASGVTMHRVSKDNGTEFMTVDFLLADGPLANAFDMTIDVESGQERLTTLSREGLIYMKQLSGRMKDLADIERLADPDA